MKTRLTRFEVEVSESNGKGWTFTALVEGNVVYEPTVKGAIVEDLKITGGSFTCCSVEPDIACECLASADDRFPQREIDKIEALAEQLLVDAIGDIYDNA